MSWIRCLTIKCPLSVFELVSIGILLIFANSTTSWKKIPESIQPWRSWAMATINSRNLSTSTLLPLIRIEGERWTEASFPALELDATFWAKGVLNDWYINKVFKLLPFLLFFNGYKREEGWFQSFNLLKSSLTRLLSSLSSVRLYWFYQ